MFEDLTAEERAHDGRQVMLAHMVNSAERFPTPCASQAGVSEKTPRMALAGETQMTLDRYVGMWPPPRSHHARALTGGAVIASAVWAVLAPSKGLTAEEAGDLCGFTESQARAALGELRLWGMARKTEARRISRRGGWLAVYVRVVT